MRSASWALGLLLLVSWRGSFAAEAIDPAQGQLDEKTKVRWYDALLLGLEGKAFEETKADYDRLPAKAEGVVRSAVWGLSRDSAGICLRFVTDAPTIRARWTLNSSGLAMPHMPATGVSGLDLYVKTDDGKWRWLAVGRPTAQTNDVQLAGGIPQGTREYLLYLPLYNGVSKLEIGVPEGTTLSKAPAREAGRDKPIVFYGTSITQGGCASRPGMVHTAIVGRWMDYPVVNLGFSGNGRMETEVAELMAEIDAAVYVIDCLPNISAEDVRARTAPVVKLLKKAHPDTPILLVEDRNYADSFLLPSKRTRNETSQAALKEVYSQLKSDGMEGVYYLEGKDLIGDDGEGTVDSSHPTDLGFYRQAQVFQAALEPILNKSE